MKTNVRAKKLVQTAKGKAREELGFLACSYRMAGSEALGHGFSIVLGSAWRSPVCLGVLRIAELVGLTYSRVYSRHSFSGKEVKPSAGVSAFFV